MFSAAADELAVEAYFKHGYLRGFLRNISENRRLIDLLNTQDPHFTLVEAEAQFFGSSGTASFTEAQVLKKELQYAIPRETDEQIRRRAVYRTGIMPASTQQIRVQLLLESCIIKGMASLPQGVSRQRLEVGVLPHFFAVTNATVLRGNDVSEEQVVIVHREALLAIGAEADAA